MIDIPNYEIGRLAGRGGVAEVYLARHKLLERRVAVKIISPSDAGELADKRFLKEARVVAGLRHPNIVSIYDVGVLENKYYIIMEYLDGGDLKQKTKGGLSVAAGLEIVKQIGSALAHAHDQGFIHRDIKSQNIMFRSDGTAVLTDFGIVKDLTADTGYTLDGTSVGTPHYMSPEQAQGSGAIDWRTDLYSLGVTFYEMLTGSVPYTADSPVAVALKHIRDPVPKLPAHLSRYQFIIDRLMAKRPEKRFQSAHELVAALEDLPSSHAVESPTEVIDYRERTALRPSRLDTGVKTVLVAAVLLAVFAAAGFGLWTHSGGFFKDRAPLAEKREPASDSDPGPVPDAPEPGRQAAQPSGERADAYAADEEPEAPDAEKSASQSASRAEIDTELLSRLLSGGDYADALNHIEKSRSRLPAPQGEMLKKADALSAEGRLMDAGDVYNALLSVDPDHQGALLGLLGTAVKQQQSIEGEKPPSAARYEAHLAFLEKAVHNTDSPAFKQLRTNAVERLHDAARVQYERGSPEAALSICRAGLEHAPEHLRLKKLALLCQARISFAERRLTVPADDNALSYYRRVLSLDPDDPDAKQGIREVADWFRDAARSAYAEKSYERALDYVDKLRSISPSDGEAELLEWRIRGDSWYARGRYRSPEKNNARYYYRRILRKDPSQTDIAVQLARAEVLGPLSETRGPGGLSEHLPRFREAFQALKAGAAEHGAEAMAGVRKNVAERIQAVIDSRHADRKQMPEAFVNLVTSYFPEFDRIFQAQYETLIARGDAAGDPKSRAGYYLEALELNPARPAARKKTEAIVRELDDAGSPEAVKVLKKAMEAAPEHPGFKDLWQSIRRVRDARAEIFTQLYRLKLEEPFSARMDSYRQLLRTLHEAVARYGRRRMADPMEEVRAQVKSDVEARKSENQLIPREFLEITAEYFPEIEKLVSNAQYDIYLQKARKAPTVSAKGEYLASAIQLNPNRPAAAEAMRDLALTADANGDKKAAVSMLEQGLAAAPANGLIADTYESIRQAVEVYPTAGGCGRQNRISEAPVTVESLDLCLEYRNFSADAILHLALAQEEGQAMEVPVVLDGGEGSQSIRVAAPVEGFALGRCSIRVKQGGGTLAKSAIQFIPKRR